MYERLMLLVLLTSFLLAGCAYAPGESGGASGLLPSVQARAADGVVEFTLQVTNAGDAPVELEFASGQRYDFRVLAGTREVWRWSADQMFTQALGSETIPAAGTVAYTETWRPDPGLTGEFVVVGTLTARRGGVEQSARFRLP